MSADPSLEADENAVWLADQSILQRAATLDRGQDPPHCIGVRIAEACLSSIHYSSLDSSYIFLRAIPVRHAKCPCKTLFQNDTFDCWKAHRVCERPVRLAARGVPAVANKAAPITNLTPGTAGSSDAEAGTSGTSLSRASITFVGSPPLTVWTAWMLESHFVFQSSMQAHNSTAPLAVDAQKHYKAGE